MYAFPPQTQVEYSTDSFVKAKPNNDRLVDYSPEDKPWDEHKLGNTTIGAMYAKAEGGEFRRFVSRLADCANELHFASTINDKTGEFKLKLRKAQFCRVRTCPTCQWRRSLMWKARFMQSIPSLEAEYPTARYLLLTLTIRNCGIADLGQELTDMNAAWHRLIKRREFKPIKGWLRATEVTKGDGMTAHPHFHVLLMVPAAYFKGRDYVKQERWVELWRDCMRLDYEPVVDIRVIRRKAKRGEYGIDEPTSTSLKSELAGAAAEVLKYATKPAELTVNPQWLYEFTRQTMNRRFMASGGTLKNLLKPDGDETDEDLAMTTEAAKEQTEDEKTLAFAWRQTDKKYRRARNLDRVIESDR